MAYTKQHVMCGRNRLRTSTSSFVQVSISETSQDTEAVGVLYGINEKILERELEFSHNKILR